VKLSSSSLESSDKEVASCGEVDVVASVPLQGIVATYTVTCSPGEVDRVAQDIAYEQTVEVSPELVTSQTILDEIVGKVDSVERLSVERHSVERHSGERVSGERLPGGRDQFLVRVVYSEHLAGGQLPQLLNLIYGNISMKSRIRLTDLELPSGLVKRFSGPRFGLEGLRRLLGVHGRPLLATALKPRGSSPQELSRMAHRFALGGGDLVKDDHNLIDSTLRDFEARVTLIQNEVEKANHSTGRHCLYLPNLILRDEELEPACEILQRAGIRGALVSPLVIGLERTRSLASKYPLFLMAHPTMSGTFFHDPSHGISPGIFLGTLFRLLGADASIFPNVGGRFTFTEADCAEICRRLAAPLGELSSSIPTPAGGMRWDNLPRMATQFGADTIYLIGSALISRSQDLQAGTREFLQQIEQHFPAKLSEPDRGFTSSCEVRPVGTNLEGADSPVASSVTTSTQRLAFRADFSWEGRPAVRYKVDEQLPFAGVARHELIGTNGEATAFDLRYFEIAPGGYSSLEKHEHTHTIIGVRGTGTLQCAGETLPIEPNDVAYVAPLSVHQLVNNGSEPFGFFCVVDHDRDRPQAP